MLIIRVQATVRKKKYCLRITPPWNQTKTKIVGSVPITPCGSGTVIFTFAAALLQTKTSPNKIFPDQTTCCFSQCSSTLVIRLVYFFSLTSILLLYGKEKKGTKYCWQLDWQHTQVRLGMKKVSVQLRRASSQVSAKLVGEKRVVQVRTRTGDRARSWTAPAHMLVRYESPAHTLLQYKCAYSTLSCAFSPDRSKNDQKYLNQFCFHIFNGTKTRNGN